MQIVFNHQQTFSFCAWYFYCTQNIYLKSGVYCLAIYISIIYIRAHTLSQVIWWSKTPSVKARIWTRVHRGRKPERYQYASEATIICVKNCYMVKTYTYCVRFFNELVKSSEFSFEFNLFSMRHEAKGLSTVFKVSWFSTIEIASECEM